MLIDLDLLIKYLAQERVLTGGVIRAIKQLPDSICCKPVKHGKWINHTDCSSCGWYMYDDVVDGKFMVGFKYCPNCGARMDLDVED